MENKLTLYERLKRDLADGSYSLETLLEFCRIWAKPVLVPFYTVGRAVEKSVIPSSTLSSDDIKFLHKLNLYFETFKATSTYTGAIQLYNSFLT